MADLAGNLWEYNFARLIVVDVSDDYRLMQPPMPSECYPVITEVWLPRHRLADRLPALQIVDGFLYDWHESPAAEPGTWIVGVVDQNLLTEEAEDGFDRGFGLASA